MSAKPKPSVLASLMEAIRARSPGAVPTFTPRAGFTTRATSEADIREDAENEAESLALEVKECYLSARGAYDDLVALEKNAFAGTVLDVASIEQDIATLADIVARARARRDVVVDGK